MPDFLLEIGCEEIPARMIEAGSLELRERVGKLLERERIAPTGAITFLDTPRRLALLAAGIPAAQPDITEQITGPSLAVAYKDGQATAAAHAFAKKVGVEISQLERTTTPKGEYLSAKVTKKGRGASEILAELRHSCSAVRRCNIPPAQAAGHRRDDFHTRDGGQIEMMPRGRIKEGPHPR